MNSDNLSSSQTSNPSSNSPFRISANSQKHSSLHHLAPQLLSKTPTSLDDQEIPHKPIKQQLKCLRNLIFCVPSTKHFWRDEFESTDKTSDIKRLKKNAKLMQNTKTLTNLSLSLKTVTFFDLTYALSRLQYLQNITILDLKITNEKHLTAPNVKILSHAITRLKNLTTFSFETPERLPAPSELIDELCLALRCLHSLSNLTFAFNSPWDLDDSHLKKLTLYLSKLDKLQSLGFRFLRSTKITNTGLQPLFLTLKNLPLLENVRIHLIGCNGCSVATFNDLFSSLATCMSLKKLDIDIKTDSGCDLNTIEPLSLGLNLLNAPSLRELSLAPYTNFTDSGLTQLSQALLRFSSLKILTINFSGGLCITDQGFCQLSYFLQALTSLSTLSLLNVGSCRLWWAIDVLSQGIAGLIQLQNLSLGFTGCFGQKSTTVQNLSSSLRKLKGLKQLKLILDYCSFFDDVDIALLAKGLEELEELSSLYVDLGHIEGLTNQGLKSFVSSFSSFSKLNHLTFSLSANGTNDDVSKIIASSLQNLPALSSVDLSFRCVEETSYNEGFGVLCDALQNLGSVRKINLEVKGTEFAKEKIKSLGKVKSVTATWLPF